MSAVRINMLAMAQMRPIYGAGSAAITLMTIIRWGEEISASARDLMWPFLARIPSDRKK